MVAEARSSETFVALCLLTVVGASLCTSQLGMSDTLGAFIAGVLLSETSFRTQARAGGGARVCLRVCVWGGARGPFTRPPMLWRPRAAGVCCLPYPRTPPD